MSLGFIVPKPLNKDKGTSLAVSDGGQTRFNGVEAQPFDLHDFLTRLVTLHERHSTMVQLERFSEELAQLVVGATFESRGVNLYLQRFT